MKGQVGSPHHYHTNYTLAGIGVTVPDWTEEIADDDDDEPPVVHLTVSAKGAIKHLKEEKNKLPEMMYVPELVRNSKQAYEDSGLTGPIVWYMAFAGEKDEKGEPLFHPGFYDHAGGISPQLMRNHLQQFRESGGSIDGKHGVGARISALRASPEGTEWYSLHKGEATGFYLWDDGDKGFASQIYENRDISVMHPSIVKAEHGTQVVLTGIDPLPASKMPSEAMAQRLSTRWWDLPSGITMHVERRRGGEDAVIVEVPVQKTALEALSEFSVTVNLSDAVVKVFVLKENLEGVPSGSRFHYSDLYRTKDGGGAKAKPKPKFYIVYEDEIYMQCAASGVPNRLRTFGITHGQRRIAMVVFPEKERYSPNDMRTRIEPNLQKEAKDGELPTTRWAKEFNEQLPFQAPELLSFIEQSAIGSEDQDMQIIDDIIDEHAAYLVGNKRRKTKVIPDENGDAEADPHHETSGEKKKKKKKKKTKKRTRKVPGKKVASNRKSKKFKAPRVVWVEPDANDELFDQSGIFLPNADDGAGALHLNRLWKPLVKWKEQAIGRFNDTTEKITEHYVELAASLIHVDVVMRSRLGKLPDPTAVDFKGAMMLPNCRDFALSQVKKQSVLIKD